MLKTSLIIDDSRLARLTLKRLLEKHQIKVYEAEGVLDAEQWVTQNVEPDLVFMDVMMPEIDGFEGLARMRANPRTSSIPVVMYSGDISDQARNKARSYGANGYLPKPADSKTLDTLLERLNKTFMEKAEVEILKQKEQLEAQAIQEQKERELREKQKRAEEEREKKIRQKSGAMPFTQQSFQAFGEAEKVDIQEPKPQVKQHNVAKTAAEEAKIAQEAAFGLAVEEERISEIAAKTAKKVFVEEGSKFRGEVPDEIRHRLNSLEEQVSVQMLKSGVENEVVADVERQRRDLAYLQRQTTSVEYQSRIAIIIGILAILICIAVAVRSLI